MLKIDFWNIVFILINLLVWYWFVRRFLFGPIMAIIEKRRQAVENDLDSAKQSRDEAQAIKEKYEAEVADARKEAASIIGEAKTRADAQYAARLDEARRDAERELADARHTIEQEREQSLKELQTQVSALAMLAAEKLLGEKNSAARDSAAYDGFLKQNGGEQ